MAGVTVTEQLDTAREEIAPSLGAVRYTVDSDEIQELGQGESSSFQQLLLQAPGVVQDEFGEVHVRGDHGDLQYRVNGVLLPESLNGFAQEIDPHLIQSVSLLTGTLPAQFGDRTAGIIDVTTKSGYGLTGDELSMYGGSYATINPAVEAGGSVPGLDYFVSASYLHNDHGIDNTTPDPNPLHDATDQERVFGYFSHALDPTSRITLLLSSSDAEFQIPDTAGIEPTYQLAGNPPADSAAANNRQFEQNYYLVLSYQRSAGALSYEVSAFSRYTGIDFQPDVGQSLLLAGTAGKVDNSDLADGVQFDASWNLGTSHTLRAGFLANDDVERLDTTTTVFPSDQQFTASPTADTLPAGGGPAPLPANPAQSSLTPFVVEADGGNRGITAGLYLQDEWQLTDGLTLNYGMRYDRFDVSFDDESQLSPRANLVWTVSDGTTLHLGYARYFMPPTLQYVPLSVLQTFEYTTNAPFNAADDPPKVERDHYFDGGFSREILPGWRITGDAFCKLARQLLDDGQFGTAVILNNFNYLTGTDDGAEFSTTLARGPVYLYANFSYVQTHARQVDTVENEFPDNELAYIAVNPIQLDHQGRYTGSGGAILTLFRDTHLHSDFLYGDGLRAGFANLDQLPSYWTVNAGVEHTWHLRSRAVSAVKLRLDCINVLNAAVELRDGTGLGIAAPAYMPRRGFYGGITLVL